MFFLGKLCNKNHDHNDTGKSLRYKSPNKRCMLCQKIASDQYCSKNREKIRKRTKQWKKDNRLLVNEQARKESKKHFEKHGISLSTEWRRKNRESYLEGKRRRRKENMKDPHFRLARNISKVICKVLNGGKSAKHWEDIVGYTFEDLRRHLEKQFDEKMRWDNYGSYWELEHIIPIVAFNFNSYKDLDFQLCWSLSNLRPLDGPANRRKHAKIEKDFQPNLAI